MMAALLAVSGATAQGQAPVTLEPAASSRTPQARVAVAPYRFGDLLWENDRTAHRIYGKPLEASEPPSGSGIDIWGKRARWPFMERRLATGQQHNDQGEGVDFFHVGGSRGVGGVGIWHDNKLWVSRNYAAHRILKNGPGEARFEVDYAPWPVDVDRRVWETRRFSLPMGSNFTRMVSTISSEKPDALLVGVGVNKRGTGDGRSKWSVDRARGVITLWATGDEASGSMGGAILVDPSQIAEVKEDAENALVLLKVTPGKPFVYYMGAAWDKGADFHSREEWEQHVLAQKPNFDPTAGDL